MAQDVNAQGISNKLCAMAALGASGPRSSTRWAVQMQRRFQTATHRASPTRCTPWLRWAGSCPKSFDSLNYTDAAKAQDVKVRDVNTQERANTLWAIV